MRMVYHKGLTPERWFARSILDQMANIGSEVFRAISWRERNADYSRNALYRALELIDLTAEDPKNIGRLREILRVREVDPELARELQRCRRRSRQLVTWATSVEMEYDEGVTTRECRMDLDEER